MITSTTPHVMLRMITDAGCQKPVAAVTLPSHDYEGCCCDLADLFTRLAAWRYDTISDYDGRERGVYALRPATHWVAIHPQAGIPTYYECEIYGHAVAIEIVRRTLTCDPRDGHWIAEYTLTS